MDLFSYKLGKKSGGGGDLSEYFDTEITHNTDEEDNYGYYSVKKTPPYIVANNVTSLDNCFDSIGVQAVDVSQMNMTNIESVKSMFYNGWFERIIGLNNWDTSNITDFEKMFSTCGAITLDCSSFVLKDNANIKGNSMFYQCSNLAKLDVSKMEFTKFSSFSSMFNKCGNNCLQSDGAYADGIPYVYVKDATQQNWVLTKSNGHPSSWTTANVIIKE